MTKSIDIIALGNLGWCYRRLLEDVVKVVRMMKEEHEEYSIRNTISNEAESRTSLNTLLKLDLQKPAKCSSYNVLLPEECEEEEASVTYIPSE